MTGAAPRSAAGAAVAVDLGGHDGAGGHRLVLAVAQGTGHGGAQRVHVEQRDAIEYGDRWVDVARDPEVDHEQRAGDAGEVRRLQHVRLGGDRRQDDIGVGQLGRDELERCRPHFERPCRGLAHQVARPCRGTVHHDDPLRRVRRRDVRQGAAHAEAHVARPDHHDAGAAQARLVLAAGDGHGGVGEGGGALADAGLGAHPLARLQRVPEECIENGSRGALFLGSLEGTADLSDHLGLARHHRFEPRGHREQVGGDVVIEADDGVGGQLLHRQVRVVGQDVVDLRHGVVEAVHHGVHLGAQACREHHRLLDVAAVVQRAERLVQIDVGHRRRLEERQRGLCVLEPYDNDGHAVPSCVGSQVCRSWSTACQSPADRRAVRPTPDPARGRPIASWGRAGLLLPAPPRGPGKSPGPATQWRGRRNGDAPWAGR